MLIQELLPCPHLPLDLQDYDDFRERYLKEVSPEVYAHKWGTVGLIYSKMFDKWKKESASETLLPRSGEIQRTPLSFARNEHDRPGAGTSN